MSRRSQMRLRQVATALVGLGAWLLTAAEDDGTSAVTLADANIETKCTENPKSDSNEDEPSATDQTVIIIDISTAKSHDTITTLRDKHVDDKVEKKEDIITTTTPAPYKAPTNGKQPEFYVDDA